MSQQICLSLGVHSQATVNKLKSSDRQTDGGEDRQRSLSNKVPFLTEKERK